MSTRLAGQVRRRAPLLASALVAIACGRPADAPRAAVLITAADLREGTPLDPAHLATLDVPLGLLTPGMIHAADAAAVVGRRLAIALRRGELVLAGVLAPDDAEPAPPTVRQGLRAVILPAAGALHVRPGDRVDVLATLREAPEAPVTVTLMQDVEVLAAAAVPPDLPGAAPATRRVTLHLLPEEAELAVQAARVGKVALSLRNPDDVEVETVLAKTTVDTLFTGSRARPLQQMRFRTLQILRGGSAAVGPATAGTTWHALSPQAPRAPWIAPGGSSGPRPGASARERAGHTESYKDYGINPFTVAALDPLSTFAVDVDTASYAIARRKILDGVLPPPEAVRVEEFLNSFHYAYPASGDAVLTVHQDAAPSPFAAGRHLYRVGIQGRRTPEEARRPAHLTFLVDVSGSMANEDKLPLAHRALRMLVDSLRPGDTVALVTYAGESRVALPPTGMDRKAEILAALDGLTAGGSTAMASGIDLAYREAEKTLDGGSISRVIILSDGDANVGPTSHQELLRMIRSKVKEGVFLTTVGFGQGNYKDETMEQLANQGNGNYTYVDSILQARKVFQEQLGGTLEVIAQDVKVQVEFDPRATRRYRLVGYENRYLADRNFRDDRGDAGEIGSGHGVTALYELELLPGARDRPLANVRVRAMRPRGEQAIEAAYAFPAERLHPAFDAASEDFRFAAAVAGVAEVLRGSPHAATWSLSKARGIACGAAAGVAERREFCDLAGRAETLRGRMAAR